MDTPRDTAPAFNKIAAELEPLLTRLGRAAPGAELETMRDEVTALLDGAGLRWSDLAARVAAPSPAKPKAGHLPPPPMPPTRAEMEELALDAERARLDDEELRRSNAKAGYGYMPDSAPGASKPTE